jgi:hypothetical protein
MSAYHVIRLIPNFRTYIQNWNTENRIYAKFLALIMTVIENKYFIFVAIIGMSETLFWR